VDQENNPKQIHIKLEANLHKALKLEAALCNKTIQDLVVEMIQQQLSLGNFADFISERE
jgi:predicted HicB family RNase H-like nuclease